MSDDCPHLRLNETRVCTLTYRSYLSVTCADCGAEVVVKNTLNGPVVGPDKRRAK